jgi:uncharacterized protein YndB with AHSA1/START domain
MPTASPTHTVTTMPATTDANDIRIIRIYDAPVALVWEVWTDSDHVGQWWGPRGFSLTTHSKDLRPGGSWVYTMHGPDGKDWPNFTRYHEVIPHQRLVYDHGATAADAAPAFRVTATFRDVGGKTELNMCMTLPTPEAAQQTRTFIKAAGGNGTWDRLAEYVEERQTSEQIFVINRTVAAPRATVFDMFATPSQLAKWLPPAGFNMVFHQDDIRPGGTATFSMSNGDFTMYARHEFRRVQRPHLIEYLQTFTDEAWNTARQPGAPSWPETNLVTVTFAEESPTETRVTVRFAIDGAATAEEVATFVAERGGMTQGWSGSFDALDELVATGG